MALTTLSEMGLINCVGQSVALKLSVPELEHWKLYNSSSGAPRVTVHTVLGLNGGDYALVLDPTCSNSTRICDPKTFSNSYVLSEGRTLLRKEKPVFAHLG